MEFKDWKPIYYQIVQDFGFDMAHDRLATLQFSKLVALSDQNLSLNLTRIRELIEGHRVLVCGNAPCLQEELKKINLGKYTVIAADGATETVMNVSKMIPDIIVTDLDGNVEMELDAVSKGAIAVIHVHGDNIDIVRKNLPKFKTFIGTTQSEPTINIFNFGGFTDGDRCVFIANRFNSIQIDIVGFDFSDNNVSDIKQKKLAWAKRLIEMIKPNPTFIDKYE
ncbi:6-hydroxymethylpterin diphosphokinase MptE-like protein [Methanosalsum natronophilum]|uniref:6-hydroxymethylpterin diphosphokinase MptE-like protein n=1 Tax=Methanosalsum natronophilum TaxID=768733 RepID=UPI0021691AF3|nr:6-hydroxymethylpterin diphosphokinase MptE-like protein [Methanosalsum natronophilum]